MLRFLPDPERATLVTAEVVSSAPRRSDWPCLENEKIIVELLRSSYIPTGTTRLLPEFFFVSEKSSFFPLPLDRLAAMRKFIPCSPCCHHPLQCSADPRYLGACLLADE